MNRKLVSALAAAADRNWTGAVLARDKKTGSEAAVYLFEGGIYSVELDDYEPSFVSRLIAAGHIDAARLASVRPSLDRDTANHVVGRIVVDCGWISVERLADYHREYLLAGLGAVIGRPSLRIRESKNDITSRLCVLPSRIGDLVSEIEIRQMQLDRASSALAGSQHAGSCVLRVMRSPAGVSNGSPELDAFMRAVDGVRSVDEIAAMCGFTRAEAVFHASVLTTAGVAIMAATAEPPRQARALRVPEDFGMLVVTAGLPGPQTSRLQVAVPDPGLDEDVEASAPRRTPRRSGAWAETVPLARPKNSTRNLITEVIARPPADQSAP